MENKIRYQPIVLFLACLAITTANAGKIKTDPASDSGVSIKLGKPMVLSCQTEDPNEIKLLEWFKYVTEDDEKTARKPVDKIPQLKGRYSIKQAEGNFIIERPNEHDDGEYECALPSGDKRSLKVSILLIVKIPENLYVVEGEKLEINCIVKGTKPNITWSFRKENGNETLLYRESDDRVKLSEFDDIDNARLTIENAQQSDRGYFGCIGNSIHMDDDVKSEGLVRVKDKYAALWPFIGICAEVFVLCAIILIYEKRRNKDSDNDSDTDQGEKK